MYNESPFIFIFSTRNNKRNAQTWNGIQLFPGVAEIAILLFADDIILIADTVTELQKKINVLQETALKLGLIVNMRESKVIVFSCTRKMVYCK